MLFSVLLVVICASSAQHIQFQVRNTFKCAAEGGWSNEFIFLQEYRRMSAASATTLLKLENVLAEITHISGKKRQSFLCLNLQPDVLYACYMVVSVTIIIHGIKKKSI